MSKQTIFVENDADLRDVIDNGTLRRETTGVREISEIGLAAKREEAGTRGTGEKRAQWTVE